MIKESCYDVIVTEKTTKDWLNEFTLNSEEEREATKEYLSEPDKYGVFFRECAWISGTTLREAYDFAKAHPDDNFYLDPDWMSTGEFINYTAEEFIEQLSEEAEELKEDNEDENAWNEDSRDFFWARRLSADEERIVRNKYGI